MAQIQKELKTLGSKAYRLYLECWCDVEDIKRELHCEKDQRKQLELKKKLAEARVILLRSMKGK